MYQTVMKLRSASIACACLIWTLTSCSSAPQGQTITFAPGDKAPVDKLTYTVVDTQIFTHLEEEASPRMPQHRFYVIQISVSNSGNADAAIPAMKLVDDSGKEYEELPNGSGVPHWLGVSRRVASNQTELGAMVFDAPPSHYKLKLTDETDTNSVFVDIPLNYAHEQMQNDAQTTSESLTTAGAEGATTPVKKK